MTTLTHVWNTGRLYQKNGQIIAAQYDDVKRVIVFSDVSRMIEGVIMQAGRIDNIHDLREVTMQRYDSMQWEDSHGEHRVLTSELTKYALNHGGK